jgi:hypothetical protein
MLRKLLLIISLLLTGAAISAAQDADLPVVLDIRYDQTVEETITAAAFYDWWVLDAEEGDILVIDMQARNGLEPLIGLLDSSGTLVARSDDGLPDSAVTLEYTAPSTGKYTIVATRVGNQSGLSTGAYTLRLRRANPAPLPAEDPYQDVTFRCENGEATTAATLQFADDPVPGLRYRLTVYGSDGFRPVIRVSFVRPDTGEPYELCNTDALRTVGDSFTLPGQETQTITEATLDRASQLGLTGADGMGTITLTIGSLNDQPGPWVALIEGFRIDPKDDVDTLDVRIGPLAALTSTLSVYMVTNPDSRLDPLLSWSDGGLACDDAGRGDCANVPAFSGASFLLNEGDGLNLKPDRSDAGLVLAPGSPDPMTLEMSSRSGDTYGGYTLILIGQLPPRPS